MELAAKFFKAFLNITPRFPQIFRFTFISIKHFFLLIPSSKNIINSNIFLNNHL